MQLLKVATSGRTKDKALDYQRRIGEIDNVLEGMLSGMIWF